MSKSNDGVIKRAIVTPDKHFPLHDARAINVVCKAIELVKPDIYILFSLSLKPHRSYNAINRGI